MHKKDRIKAIIAVVIFGSIGLGYWMFGKDIAKIIAVIGFVIWLGAMYHLNKQAKN